MICKHCGNDMLGDGYNSVYRCVNIREPLYSEIEEFAEPDSGPWYCSEEDFTE